ncbi:MAG: hypothetical protein JXQ30_13975 [Spirochaetes bacterium]|nr:hypothetical protein [Spirochaetota bacterium]
MKRMYIKPWIFGVCAGIMFVSAEAFLKFYPPACYSFCLTCHVRDLVNTVTNVLFGTRFETAYLARKALMLTSPGLLVGAFVASRLFGEYRRIRKSRPLLYFLAGFTVMILGILIFGCPTRIVMRAGYGDLYGVTALFGLFAGVYIGMLIMKRLKTAVLPVRPRRRIG